MPAASSVARTADPFSANPASGVPSGIGRLHTLVVGWRVVQRGLRLIAHLLLAMPLAAGLASARWLGGAAEGSFWARINQAWQRRLLGILGVQIEWEGAIPAGRTLCVPNHVSWIDPVVLGSVFDTRCVAKAELRGWPVIGWLAIACGALFIRRGGHQTAGINRRLAEWLRSGGRAVVFPEATTTDGGRVSYCFPRLLGCAQDSHAWVQPVAIQYLPDQGRPSAAPYIDDMSFLPHLYCLLKQPRTRVRVHGLPAYAALGWARHELAAHCRRDIAHALGLPASIDQKTDMNVRAVIARIRGFKSPPREMRVS